MDNPKSDKISIYPVKQIVNIAQIARLQVQPGDWLNE